MWPGWSEAESGLTHAVAQQAALPDVPRIPALARLHPGYGSMNS
jgi:hypothetical protein